MSEQTDQEDIQMATQQRFYMLRALHSSSPEFRQAAQLARTAVNGMANSMQTMEEYTAVLTGISLATLDLQIKPKTEEDFQNATIIRT